MRFPWAGPAREGSPSACANRPEGLYLRAGPSEEAHPLLGRRWALARGSASPWPQDLHRETSDTHAYALPGTAAPMGCFGDSFGPVNSRSVTGRSSVDGAPYFSSNGPLLSAVTAFFSSETSNEPWPGKWGYGSYFFLERSDRAGRLRTGFLSGRMTHGVSPKPLPDGLGLLAPAEHGPSLHSPHVRPDIERPTKSATPHHYLWAPREEGL